MISSTALPAFDPTQIPIETKQRQLATAITFSTALILGLLAALFLIGMFYQPQFWQLYVLALAFGLASLIVLSTIANAPGQTDYRQAMPRLAPTFQISLLILAILSQSTAVYLAILSFLYGIMVATGVLEEEARESAISRAFFVAVATALVGSLFPQFQLSIPLISDSLPILLGALVMIYLVLLSLDYVTVSLRVRLVTSALGMAIVPLILLSLVDTRFIFTSLQNQSNQALRLAAQQVAQEIDAFLTSNRDSLITEANLSVFYDYLIMDPAKRQGSPQEEQLRVTVNSLLLKHETHLVSYGLLNLRGQNIYDSNPAAIGQDESKRDYFMQVIRTGRVYISPIEFNPDNKVAYIYFAVPIRNERQQIIGVLRLEYDAQIFQRLLERKLNLLGLHSYPILLDENLMRIADAMTPTHIYKFLTPPTYTQTLELAKLNRLPYHPYVNYTNQTDLARVLRHGSNVTYFTLEVHPDRAGHLESGVAVRLQTRPWYVLFVREQSTLLALLQAQGRLAVIIAALFAAVVGLVASWVSGALSAPVVQLKQTAEQITAGDLEAEASVESRDEIGALGRAFNTMTAQLRSLINELEDRVRERTRELAQQNEALRYRTRQLQTVADVARSIVSAQALESLLNQVTILISERFGFYHVGVFLLDEKGEYAVLRAANSEGGKRMLARQHKLPVGKVGIVGYVTATGQPRIATDVGEDAVHFKNPDLPETRSEMALPLIANNRIIGALDVQSTQPNAFTPEDIELFSTLADQIAIAIVNNQLLEETMHALDEARRVNRRYLQQEWEKEVRSRRHRAYIYTSQGVFAQPPLSRPDIEAAIRRGAVTATPAEGEQAAVLTVPIQLRDEILGVIRVQDLGSPERAWTDEEIEALKAVAAQVALALENARLLETTLRRAERERKALEITGRIRAATDPQTMLDIAMEELKRALNASHVQIVFRQPTTSPSTNGVPGNGKDQ
ncbi:GAF domain-containing protein [uncultured Thermanaerothrix sp.]|uniref:GAF domain-containing protein n=1 Tax=uncultured Thermanaerothrix sp. TaxID=1195149 RepID=UPI00261A0455|nr:GAF domain-containing protein [uncultured Thermanaerothrix sp.]